MALEVKPAKNSKLPKLPENCFQPVGKVGGHQYPPGSKKLKYQTNFEGRETCGGVCGPIITMLYNMEIGVPL